MLPSLGPRADKQDGTGRVLNDLPGCGAQAWAGVSSGVRRHDDEIDSSLNGRGDDLVGGAPLPCKDFHRNSVWVPFLSQALQILACAIQRFVVQYGNVDARLRIAESDRE